jgi:NAD(P)-dependent dehydrogenase (short-subunit alcohol dehydrogenase family)
MMAVTGPVKLGFTPGDAVIVTGAGSGIGRAAPLAASAQLGAFVTW